ncbi:MAG: hypothetical protein DRP66_11400 [Planctomycetota bacterium]|nr:MAG: hypothetical protein DRP66_11400 [Planctomycetota bacterium]
MNKPRGFLSILIPSATVFFSSACIMIIELVAGRLMARYLGASLYTWTSVIGVVLAGITIGNYIGGRIADRFSPRKTLSVLFAAASVACVIIVILNNLVGKWGFVWHFSWPLHVFTHVTLVFLLPSVCLGTISPVVAKMALDQGLSTGRTVGDIYAWGAAGSIAGTFLAGFYLIAKMGTISIVWSVAAALLLMAILYWAKLWVLYIWAAILIALVTMGMAPGEWARQNGPKLALREKHDPTILYEDETQYCYIVVKKSPDNPNAIIFCQDKLQHSKILIDNITNLQYFYTHVYAAITEGLKRNKANISTMSIGGGGYVFPRYVEKLWPDGRIDVIEIDPGVTEAAMASFGLPRDTKIKTISMDARNSVDGLLEKKKTGQEIPLYDFIYEDAFNDYSVPYQLVTKEFNEKISKILTDDGVYLLNLIDIYDSGLFLGSTVNTLEKTFPHVYVLSEEASRSIRNTFVVVASKKSIDVHRIMDSYHKGADIWHLTAGQISDIKAKSKGMVFTDDYVPVENMLAPVVLRSAADLRIVEYKNEARKLKHAGQLNKCIAKYRKLIKLDPGISILAYNEIAMMMVQQGKLKEARIEFINAIEYNNQSETRINVAGVHLNLAFVLRDLKYRQEAKKHFDKAVEAFKEQLSKEPDSLKTTMLLGKTLLEINEFTQATVYLRQAVKLNPYDVSCHLSLAQALKAQAKYDEAITGLEKAIAFYSKYNRTQEVERIKKYLELLESEKSKQRQ